MEFKKIQITPDMAREFLKKNPMNRKLKVRVVSQYAMIMKNGDWNEDSPEVISFSTNGQLLNGQHRLNAIVMANKPISMWVAEGCSKEVFSVLDQGSKRTTADALEIIGVDNARSTA